MTGYTKLFASIIGSTVWREANHVRIVWVTLMALADRRGIVEASVPGLAGFARVSRRQCDEALARLQAPDPDSRSPAEEGRRIREVPGGWQLVNFSVYREKMGADERREYKRLKEQERRRREKSERVDTSVDTRGQMRTNVDAVDTVPEAEAETETTPKERTARGRVRALRYAFEGRVLALTPGQHGVLLRMANGVDLDWIGDVYPSWDRELQASGAPTDQLVWCLARLKQRLRIGRDGQGPRPALAEDAAVFEELATRRRAKSERDEARQAEREELAEGVLPLLTEDERAAVEAEAVESVQAYRRRMTSAGYQEALAQARRRALLQQVSEPDLKARVREHLKATKPLRLRPPDDDGEATP